MNPELSHVDIFKVFLMHHNAWDKFVNNNGYNLNKHCLVNDMLVQAGFTWTFSPEGFYYWDILNNKWISLCNHYGLIGVSVKL